MKHLGTRLIERSRLLHKPSKRDLEASRARVLRDDARFRCESLPGELPFENDVKIDNFHLSPESAAAMIRQRFDL